MKGNFTEKERAQARRHRMFLYLAMAVMMVAPLVLFWLFG